MHKQTEVSAPVNIKLFKIICLAAIFTMGLVYFYPGFYSFNQLIAVTMPFLVIVSAIILNKKMIFDKWTAEVYFFLYFWLCYGIIGLIWTRNTHITLYYIRSIIIYLLSFVLITQLMRNQKYRKVAFLILQIVFYSYCLIYIWEMATLKHLSFSRLYEIQLPIPTGFYYNENNSAVFMMLLAPFLTVKTAITSSRIGKAVALASFLFMIVTSALQDSRLALLFMVLMGIYYFIRAGLYLKIITILIITMSFFIFVKVFPEEFKLTEMIFNQRVQSTLNESKSYIMTSSKIRIQLNKESINLAVKSNLFGVGAGGYEIFLGNNRYHRTSWVLNPHNWWLELLANFGIIIFLGMIFIYLRWFYRLFQLRNSCKNSAFDIYDACFISLLLFIPLSIVPSSIKNYYSIWVYFGLIHSVCIYPPQNHSLENV